jgi:hypothetical protein
MRWLLQWSFGCRHANTSFPQTVPSRRGVAAPPQPAHRSTEHQRRGLGTPAGGGHSNGGGHSHVGGKVTYVTCLSCGQEFNYCWRTMQRLSSAPAWIEEQMTGNRSSRELREIEELRHLWMT